MGLLVQPATQRSHLDRTNQNVRWWDRPRHHGRKRRWARGPGQFPRKGPCGLSVWFQLTSGLFFLLLACAKKESSWQRAFHVIGTDGHQTHRAEVDTPCAADFGETEQLGCDRKPWGSVSAPRTGRRPAPQDRGFAVFQIRTQSKPKLGVSRLARALG